MVIALLTVPMAVARLVTQRLALLIPVATLVPLIAGVFGLWVSFDLSVQHRLTVSPGALVVLAIIALYLLAVLIAALRRAARRAHAMRSLPKIRGGAAA